VGINDNFYWDTYCKWGGGRGKVYTLGLTRLGECGFGGGHRGHLLGTKQFPETANLAVYSCRARLFTRGREYIPSYVYMEIGTYWWYVAHEVYY